MNSDKPEVRIAQPWRKLQVVIWLVGIYLLAKTNLWWPGILVLVGTSILYEYGIYRVAARYEKALTPSPPTTTPSSIAPGTTPAIPAATLTDQRMDLLPQSCPGCGGPIRGHEVKWTGPESASCPYCGTNLPMNKT